MMFVKVVLRTPSTLYYCINFADIYADDIRPLKSEEGSEATCYV